MEPDLRSEEGLNADNMDTLLDLEEGFTSTPAINCPQQISFATPRGQISPLSLEGNQQFHFDHLDKQSSVIKSHQENSQSSVGGSSVHTTPNMADPITTKLKNYFTKDTPVADGDFAENEIVITNEDRGVAGTAEYHKVYNLITTAMEEKFGAAKLLS